MKEVYIIICDKCKRYFVMKNAPYGSIHLHPDYCPYCNHCGGAITKGVFVK